MVLGNGEAGVLHRFRNLKWCTKRFGGHFFGKSIEFGIIGSEKKRLQRHAPPPSVTLAHDEFISHVDGTASSQRVVRHIGGTSWPGIGAILICCCLIVRTSDLLSCLLQMARIGTRLTRSGVQRTNASSSTSTGDVQPPPSQLASMPSSLGDAEGDDVNTNSQAEGSNMPKKVRGKSCGENIHKAIAKNGGRKLQILIPEHLARPVENASLLATGIGIIIRHHAPLINIKSYDDILSQDKEKLYGGLKAWFEFVDIETDPLVQDKLDDMLRTAFICWKNRMHVAYNESKDAGHNPIEDCPFEWFEEGVWEAVCGSFEEPKYKRRSDTNKDNRSKLLYRHASGSQPFHVRYYRMAEAERSHVKNWRDCHTKKNGRIKV